MNRNTGIEFLHDCPLEHFHMAIQSKIFNAWLIKTSSRFNIESITVTVVDFHSTPSTLNVLFVRMKVKTSTSPRQQIVELRGGTVAMLTILKCERTRYTVLVKQARVATGDFEFIEIPAGMIDHDTFTGAAARELEEELGLTFSESELINITGQQGGLYLSPGILDETCTFFLAERTVSPQELESLRDKTCGVENEGEFIKLMIVPLSDLPKVTKDAKSILAYFLFQEHLEEELSKLFD